VVTDATAIAMLSLAGGQLATAVVLAGGSAAHEAGFAVFVAAKLVATLALLPVAGLVLANARAIASHRRLDRWLVHIDIEIATMRWLPASRPSSTTTGSVPGGPTGAVLPCEGGRASG